MTVLKKTYPVYFELVLFCTHETFLKNKIKHTVSHENLNRNRAQIY